MEFGMRPQVGSQEPDARFLLADYEPACLALYREGRLPERVAAALRELEDCCACPRKCLCNRLENETRACHTGRYAVVSSAFPHFGEEDCLRGWRGSGTIFFGLCNLRCSFCQNWDISQKLAGRRSWR
jgi:putative pyruvate formate lyase activating enzyme